MPRLRLRATRPELWTLLVIALIGVTRIPEPFDGLQALFTMMADSLRHGATLYVDIWDTKQPGIFLFYELAGRLFGFTEIGTHAFELIYQLVAASLLIWVMRRELRQPLFACLAGFFAVGMYYLVATGRHLGQIEGLVGLPILATIALASGPAASRAERRRRMFGAGIAAGMVALFKLILSPIPAMVWLVAYLVRRDDEGPSATCFLKDWLFPAAGGTALVLGGTALWAALHHGLPELLWASFVYPVRASLDISRAPWARLESSVFWFVGSHWIVLLLALCSGIGWRGWKREAMVLQAVAWLLMGVALILAQKLSYWSYHFELLAPPVAILAARGCDGIVSRLEWLQLRPRTIVAVLVAISIVAGSHLTVRRLSWALEDRAEPAPLVAFRDDVSPAYREWRPAVSFLSKPSALPGPIYVFGNPIVLWLSHREQAGAIQGWSWEHFVQALWDRLPRQLATSRPAYVLVSRGYDALLRKRSPATLELLREDYQVHDSSARGIWYQRIAAAHALLHIAPIRARVVAARRR